MKSFLTFLLLIILGASTVIAQGNARNRGNKPPKPPKGNKSNGKNPFKPPKHNDMNGLSFNSRFGYADESSEKISSNQCGR